MLYSVELASRLISIASAKVDYYFILSKFFAVFLFIFLPYALTKRITHSYSGDTKKLNLKDQGRATGNAGLREFAIAFFRRNIDLPLIAHTHLL